MSVLIKGMEMPKDCARCQFGDGYACFATGYIVQDEEWETKRASFCPLIQLPPHGRLIDADALITDVRKHSESYFADDFAHEWVDIQPTIIEAEGVSE